jgi:hypothetical protein
MSMAIPVIAPQRAIPSLGTELSPDIQLKTDGGVTDNTADHVFDARPEPRIAVVLDPVNEPVSRLYHWEPRKQALALFRAMLFASSSLKSKRSDGVVLHAPAIGSGLDFALSDAQKHLRWSARLRCRDAGQGNDSVGDVVVGEGDMMLTTRKLAPLFLLINIALVACVLGVAGARARRGRCAPTRPPTT